MGAPPSREISFPGVLELRSHVASGGNVADPDRTGSDEIWPQQIGHLLLGDLLSWPIFGPWLFWIDREFLDELARQQSVDTQSIEDVTSIRKQLDPATGIDGRLVLRDPRCRLARLLRPVSTGRVRDRDHQAPVRGQPVREAIWKSWS